MMTYKCQDMLEYSLFREILYYMFMQRLVVEIKTINPYLF